MDTTTSRTAALDFLLSIWNLLALADHKEEQISNLIEERTNLSSVASNEEELQALTQSINEELVETQRQRERLYEVRKELQISFFKIYNIDQDYWCQFKHFAVSLTALEECRNAHPSPQMDQLLIKFRRLVYQFLGVILWGNPANCWRCLTDMLTTPEEDLPQTN